jgi:hypothetical protein
MPGRGWQHHNTHATTDEQLVKHVCDKTQPPRCSVFMAFARMNHSYQAIKQSDAFAVFSATVLSSVLTPPAAAGPAPAVACAAALLLHMLCTCQPCLCIAQQGTCSTQQSS